MTLDELIEIQKRFQPYLLNQDYTFIGPDNGNLLEPFMQRANEIAPVVGLIRETKHILGNQEATLKALSIFPDDTKLRVYIVNGKSDAYLLHSTIEDYCADNNIEFEIE